jgi:adenylate cyclase
MRSRARVVAFLTLLGTVLGVAYAAISGGGQPSSFARGVLAGLPISLGLSLFEAYVVDGPYGRRLRSLRFVALLAIRIAVWLAIIVAGLVAMRTILPIAGEASIFSFLGDVAFGLSLVTIALAYLSIDRLLGKGNLWRLLIGRYHRPREEARIFLFLDMEGSTSAAEKLGATGFLELLGSAVLDATGPLLDARGDIYRYVGDEIIVTWPIVRAEDAVRGALATIAALDALGPAYTKRFGVAPRFRGGLHGGRVVVGEIGDARREIVYLGDAVNVAKRLETEAGLRRARLLVSGDVAAGIGDPDLRARLADLGEIPIVGRTAPLRVFAATI